MRGVILPLVLGAVLLGLVNRVEAVERSLEIAIEAAQAEYPVGTPILLKLTVRNTGAEPQRVQNIGWGEGISIAVARDDGEFQQLDPTLYVSHGDTEVGPVYMPTYVTSGTLKPGEEQSILQMIYTHDMQPGRLRFRASLWSRKSEEIAVTLVEPADEAEGGLVGPEARGPFLRTVARLHNHGPTNIWLRDEERTALMQIASKALESTKRDVEVEYGLYAGVLQAAADGPSAESIVLAEQCARVLIERFPKTWLQAHVDAALVIAHVNRARVVAEQGRERPLAKPLFEGLGITKWLDETKGSDPLRRSE